MTDGTRIVVHPDRATLVVTGEDRLEWLQGLVTCDLAGLGEGQGRWTLFLAKVGKVISDATVLVGQSDLLLGVPAERLEVLMDHLSDFLVMEDAEIEEVRGLSWLSLFGARAAEDARLAIAERRGFRMAEVQWGRGTGVALVGPEAEQGAVRSALEARGGVVLSEEAVRAMRIRSFMPSFGVDFDERQSPHDASVERMAVSWDKGCYLGQEAVCMLDMRGKVKRRLVSLSVDGAPPARGAEVLAEGVAVGEVTSAAADAQGTVAFARLKASALAPGTRLSVGGLPARVLEGPPAL